MANLVAAEADRMLNASLNGTTYTLPTTPMKLALCTAVGTATAAGTEVSGGSYARQTIAWTTSAGAGISNSGIVSFASMPAATVTSLDIFDNNGTPRRCWFGTLASSKTTSSGDTLSFAVGAITIALS